MAKRRPPTRARVTAASKTGKSKNCKTEHDHWNSAGEGDFVNSADRYLEDLIGLDHAAKATFFPYGKKCGNLWRALGWQFMSYDPLNNKEMSGVIEAMQSRLEVPYDSTRILPGGGYMGACCSCW